MLLGEQPTAMKGLAWLCSKATHCSGIRRVGEHYRGIRTMCCFLQLLRSALCVRMSVWISWATYFGRRLRDSRSIGSRMVIHWPGTTIRSRFDCVSALGAVKLSMSQICMSKLEIGSKGDVFGKKTELDGSEKVSFGKAEVVEKGSARGGFLLRHFSRLHSSLKKRQAAEAQKSIFKNKGTW